MPGTFEFASAFHQRIPQRAIISGMSLGWSWCTMPPCCLGSVSNFKVAPGGTCTSARDEAGLAGFVEDLRRLTAVGDGSRSAEASAAVRCHADCM